MTGVRPCGHAELIPHAGRGLPEPGAWIAHIAPQARRLRLALACILTGVSSANSAGPARTSLPIQSSVGISPPVPRCPSRGAKRAIRQPLLPALPRETALRTERPAQAQLAPLAANGNALHPEARAVRFNPQAKPQPAAVVMFAGSFPGHHRRRSQRPAIAPRYGSETIR